MNYKLFRDHVKAAGLTNKQFAELVGIRSNSITNYSKGEYVPDHWGIVAVLMDELKRNGIEFRHLLEQLDIAENKVRGGAAPGRWGASKQMDLLPRQPSQ